MIDLKLIVDDIKEKLKAGTINDAKFITDGIARLEQWEKEHQSAAAKPLGKLSLPPLPPFGGPPPPPFGGPPPPPSGGLPGGPPAPPGAASGAAAPISLEKYSIMALELEYLEELRSLGSTLPEGDLRKKIQEITTGDMKLKYWPNLFYTACPVNFEALKLLDKKFLDETYIKNALNSKETHLKSSELKSIKNAIKNAITISDSFSDPKKRDKFTSLIKLILEECPLQLSAIQDYAVTGSDGKRVTKNKNFFDESSNTPEDSRPFEMAVIAAGYTRECYTKNILHQINNLYNLNDKIRVSKLPPENQDSLLKKIEISLIKLTNVIAGGSTNDKLKDIFKNVNNNQPKGIAICYIEFENEFKMLQNTDYITLDEKNTALQKEIKELNANLTKEKFPAKRQKIKSELESKIKEVAPLAEEALKIKATIENKKWTNKELRMAAPKKYDTPCPPSDRIDTPPSPWANLQINMTSVVGDVIKERKKIQEIEKQVAQLNLEKSKTTVIKQKLQIQAKIKTETKELEKLNSEIQQKEKPKKKQIQHAQNLQDTEGIAREYIKSKFSVAPEIKASLNAAPVEEQKKEKKALRNYAGIYFNGEDAIQYALDKIKDNKIEIPDGLSDAQLESIASSFIATGTFKIPGSDDIMGKADLKILPADVAGRSQLSKNFTFDNLMWLKNHEKEALANYFMPPDFALSSNNWHEVTNTIDKVLQRDISMGDSFCLADVLEIAAGIKFRSPIDNSKDWIEVKVNTPSFDVQCASSTNLIEQIARLQEIQKYFKALKSSDKEIEEKYYDDFLDAFPEADVVSKSKEMILKAAYVADSTDERRIENILMPILYDHIKKAPEDQKEDLPNNIYKFIPRQDHAEIRNAYKNYMRSGQKDPAKLMLAFKLVRNSKEGFKQKEFEQFIKDHDYDAELLKELRKTYIAYPALLNELRSSDAAMGAAITNINEKITTELETLTKPETACKSLSPNFLGSMANDAARTGLFKIIQDAKFDEMKTTFSQCCDDDDDDIKNIAADMLVIAFGDTLANWKSPPSLHVEIIKDHEKKLEEQQTNALQKQLLNCAFFNKDAETKLLEHLNITDAAPEDFDYYQSFILESIEKISNVADLNKAIAVTLGGHPNQEKLLEFIKDEQNHIAMEINEQRNQFLAINLIKQLSKDKLLEALDALTPEQKQKLLSETSDPVEMLAALSQEQLTKLIQTQHENSIRKIELPKALDRRKKYIHNQDENHKIESSLVQSVDNAKKAFEAEAKAKKDAADKKHDAAAAEGAKNSIHEDVIKELTIRKLDKAKKTIIDFIIDIQQTNYQLTKLAKAANETKMETFNKTIEPKVRELYKKMLLLCEEIKSDVENDQKIIDQKALSYANDELIILFNSFTKLAFSLGKLNIGMLNIADSLNDHLEELNRLREELRIARMPKAAAPAPAVAFGNPENANTIKELEARTRKAEEALRNTKIEALKKSAASFDSNFQKLANVNKTESSNMLKKLSTSFSGKPFEKSLGLSDSGEARSLSESLTEPSLDSLPVTDMDEITDKLQALSLEMDFEKEKKILEESIRQLATQYNEHKETLKDPQTPSLNRNEINLSSISGPSDLIQALQNDIDTLRKMEATLKIKVNNLAKKVTEKANTGGGVRQIWSVLLDELKKTPEPSQAEITKKLKDHITANIENSDFTIKQVLIMQAFNGNLQLKALRQTYGMDIIMKHINQETAKQKLKK